MLYLIGGSPCSGKSTIAAYLAERYQLLPIKLDDLVEEFTQKAGFPMSYKTPPIPSWHLTTG